AALRGSLTIATAVAARIGTDDLAAYQIAFEIWGFLALTLDAIAIAGQAMIGHRLGSGDAAGSRAAGRRMIEWGLVAGIVVGAVVAPLQPVNGVVFVLDGILIGAGDLRFLAWAMVGGLAAFLPAALGVLVFDLGL